jgi:uncharacterized membrane protein
MVRNELRILLPRAAAIDIVIVLATLPIYGLGCEIPLGLLLGTAAMTVNITLLGYASEHCVERPLKQAKRYMFSFYLLRMVILGTAIVMGFKLSFLNSVAVCLPLFYPKVIYTVRAIVRRNKE